MKFGVNFMGLSISQLSYSSTFCHLHYQRGHCYISHV